MSWLDNINKTFGEKRDKVIVGMMVFAVLVVIAVGTALYFTAA